MEYIIHLTDKCNLECKYCYEKKQNKVISFESIKNIINYEIGKKNPYSVFVFYGGEPLLKKDLIEKTIDYINSLKTKTKFYYGITTNGLLMDDKFIDYMKKNNFVNIAYSIDGIQKAHDLNRKTINNKDSFKIVEENLLKVLKQFEDVTTMTVVTKNNLAMLDKSVEYLIKIGVKNINILFDYSADWQDSDLKEIKKQINKVTNIYAREIKNENDINIPIIDEKIKSYINDKFNCNDNCKFGNKTINVGTDGNLYPCMQFVNNNKYIIGNCKDGIDNVKLLKLLSNSAKENDICKDCSVKKRCKHTCACKNYKLTNDVNGLSPLTCETERIFIEAADKMAEKLYKENSKLFIQKYYNKDYNKYKMITNMNKKEN